MNGAKQEAKVTERSARRDHSLHVGRWGLQVEYYHEMRMQNKLCYSKRRLT